jgi:hypothetical protein
MSNILDEIQECFYEPLAYEIFCLEEVELGFLARLYFCGLITVVAFEWLSGITFWPIFRYSPPLPLIVGAWVTVIWEMMSNWKRDRMGLAASFIFISQALLPIMIWQLRDVLQLSAIGQFLLWSRWYWFAVLPVILVVRWRINSPIIVSSHPLDS